MKRFLTVFCVAMVSGAALSAQEAADTTIRPDGKDTLVVIVKHEKGEGFFEKTGKPFRKGYKAVEDAVVGGYQAIEDAVVGAYQKIEDKFVEKFLDVEEEVIEMPEDDTAKK